MPNDRAGSPRPSPQHPGRRPQGRAFGPGGRTLPAAPRRRRDSERLPPPARPPTPPPLPRKGYSAPGAGRLQTSPALHVPPSANLNVLPRRGAGENHYSVPGNGGEGHPRKERPAPPPGTPVRAGGQHRCRRVRPLPPPSAGAAQAAGRPAAAATGSAKRTRAARASRAGRRHVPCCGRRAPSPSRERGGGRRGGGAGRRRALGPENLGRASAAVSASGASNTSGLNFPAPGPANTRSRRDTRAPAEPLRGEPSGPGASAAASSALPGSHWRGGSCAIYLFPPPRSFPRPRARAPLLRPSVRAAGRRGSGCGAAGMRAARGCAPGGPGGRERAPGCAQEARGARPRRRGADAGEGCAAAPRPGPSPCAPGRRLCCPPRGWPQPPGTLRRATAGQPGEREPALSQWWLRRCAVRLRSPHGPRPGPSGEPPSTPGRRRAEPWQGTRRWLRTAGSARAPGRPATLRSRPATSSERPCLCCCGSPADGLSNGRRALVPPSSRGRSAWYPKLKEG